MGYKKGDGSYFAVLHYLPNPTPYPSRVVSEVVV